MEFSNHGGVTRMASGITLRSCSSKGVNTQMEVNDWPIQSGGDDENTTRALKAEVLHSRWFLPEIGSFFFIELKHRGKHLLMTYAYFLTSLNYVLKLLD